MILTGHQPEYLPYIGFFNKIMLADKFVLVDHVQFNKKNWQNRNKIRTKDGWIWLTVPVLSKSLFNQPINEVRINNEINWREKHWKSIYLNYHKAPYFKEHALFFEHVYSFDWEKVVNINESIIRYILKVLNIDIEICKSSELKIEGKKSDLIVDMCKALNADSYLSGEGAKDYIDENKFKESNIRNYFREMTPPVYTQQFMSFEPYMSVIDLLFNYGNEQSRNMISSCGKIKKEEQ